MRACEQPGRNERRSGGHGRGAPNANARPKRFNASHVKAFQRLTVPAAMAGASSGLAAASGSPIQTQLKEKTRLVGVEPATAVVRGHGCPVTFMAEP